jgi:starch synthase
MLTTVSPSYATEILGPDKGFGLDGVLLRRTAALTGILNGIDYNEWDPSRDALLPANYSSDNLTGKATCKKALMERFGFAGSGKTPLCCFIGRISEQKGIDLLAAGLETIVAARANCFILGTGDEQLHLLLAEHAAPFTDRICFRIGFDEPLAHLAYAAADIFLMPSVYEPCGLGQLIAMRYGTVPVAYATGGLIDTIESPGDPERFMDAPGSSGSTITGFLFRERSKAAFGAAIRHAVLAHERPDLWQRMVTNDMTRDFSWERSARLYLKLYNGEPVSL